MTNAEIKLVECPRDAMQGIVDFIPTSLKARYLNLLFKVGFHTLDFGSFVSAKAIPQMKDTSQLLKLLDLRDANTKLLAIVANQRGAKEACSFEEISYLGFPFSVSETFQQRNTHASIAEALKRVAEIQDLCTQHHKSLVVYLSMGFGNPYGDAWNLAVLSKWTEQLIELGVETLSLADTTGLSSPQQIKEVYPYLTRKFPQANWGLHLHADPANSKNKIEAAFAAGCTRFDSTLRGYGGCPMAADDLTGNIATENVLEYLRQKSMSPIINERAWQEAMVFSSKIFG